MATWQYTLKIIPEDFRGDTELAWEGREVFEDAIKELAKVFPMADSWDEHLEIYGDLQSTCVEVWREDGRVTQISTRLDLRNISEETAGDIVRFAQSINGVFEEVDGKIVKPEMKDMNKGILASDAYQFVQNSNKFLDSKRIG